MISPRFATMLCFVQTDAVAVAGDRRPAARRVREALVRPHQRRRPALDQRHRDPAWPAARAACTSRPRPRTSCASARRSTRCCATLALRIVADGEGARRIGRVVVRGGDGDAVERVARAVANSPLVKTALFGGDPNWGRIAQAIGAALPGTRAARVRHRDRGRQVCRAAPRARSTRGARRGGRPRRGPLRDRPARRGRGDRGLLLRPRPRLREDQRGVHDLIDMSGCATSPPCSRRCPTSASSTARRSSSSTAARRWTTRCCARSSRATSCCSSTSA